MPIYEYRCNDCGNELRVTCSLAEYDDGVPVKCECGSHNVRRLYRDIHISWNFPGSTRYHDKRVERGLALERRKYGAPLTDDAARRVNASKGLTEEMDHLAEAMDDRGSLTREEIEEVLKK